MGDIFNPLTGEAVAKRQHHSTSDLQNAVARARQAQPEWHGAGFAYRARIIRALAPLIADRSEQLTDVICAASGKPRVDALGTELLPAALLCRYYPRLARRVLRPQRIRGSSILFFNKRSLLVREPYGVIGIISPWNYPFGIPMHELVQALRWERQWWNCFAWPACPPVFSTSSICLELKRGMRSSIRESTSSCSRGRRASVKLSWLKQRIDFCL
jgi:acyl-CoA reductase-like NAD-dependent aldehyde dehydrogenase